MQTRPTIDFARDIGTALERGAATVVPVSGSANTLNRFSDGTAELHVGTGTNDGTLRSRRDLIRAVRRMVQAAKHHKIGHLAIGFDDFCLAGKDADSVSEAECASLIAENAVMANLSFSRFKTQSGERPQPLERITVCGSLTKRVKDGFARGSIVGEEVNNCRELANAPGGEMTPKRLARAARDAARGTNVRVRILGRADMRKNKMGAVLGVGQGSSEEPQFIIMEYRGASESARKKQPIVLVGKGVTFDTGGINLKPSNGVLDMHMDMSGGAAVIHSVILAARLGVKRPVIGLVPAVENMPSGSSYRPSDILHSMSGLTIEVHDTDAEGRVILADALHYAKRYKPELVVDIATLTGGAITALGQRASALFTRGNDAKLTELFYQKGEESGDYVWPLPLGKENEDDVKGVFGDVANLPPGGSKASGSATAGAAFLAHFTNDASGKPAYPWVHLDIAPRMTSISSDHLAKGAAGAPVRLIAKILEDYK